MCSVATATDAFEAAVVNLSKSGAAILGPDGAAKMGESVTLLIERSEGLMSVALPGEVVRIEERGERMLYGVDFSALPPDEQNELSMLLQMISTNHGPGRREHPRVSARIAVNCRSEDAFRAWLNDLSKGGLSVKCARAVKLGRTLTVSFGLPGLKGLVEISGEVVSAQPIEGGQWRLGVRFAPLSEDERDQVNRALDTLLGIALPQGEIIVDD
jgi:c-di-GMP-binding flagellar brake protein YcgR